MKPEVKAAESNGFVRCDCGDEDGLPHCGWWFKDRKAYIEDDLVGLFNAPFPSLLQSAEDQRRLELNGQ